MCVRFTLPVLATLAVLICVSAKSFTATCNYNEATQRRHSHKRRFGGRRGYGVGRQVKGSPRTRPALYGVKTDTIDVVLNVWADDAVEVFINGETNDSWEQTSCYGNGLSIPATLTGGDVLSFVAENFNFDYGLDVAITSASGEQVYVTTGQAGWKGVPYILARSGWKEPGFDDSDWPALVQGEISGTGECKPSSLLNDAGAVPMWTEKYADTIAVRYVVPTPAPTPTPTPPPNNDCACTEGACDDGTCHYCLFDQGGGRLVCYQDWNQDSCNDAGDSYKWCGN